MGQDFDPNALDLMQSTLLNSRWKLPADLPMMHSRGVNSDTTNLASTIEYDTPLFIVGCGRSGTTLLRLMLNAHPQMCIPEESHVLYRIARLRSFGRWPKSGTAAFEAAFFRHIDESPFIANWGFPEGALRGRVSKLNDRNLGAMLGCMYAQYSQQEGKPRWGDKTPMHVQYMWLVRHFFPGARFVHIIRDARDVGQSVLAKSWGPRRLSHAGLYWKWLVLSGIISGRMLGPKSYHQIRFEDLIREPEETLRGVASFADLPYTDDLLNYHQSQAAHFYAEKGNEGSKRLRQQLDPERIFLWRERMSMRDQRSFDRQAGATMRLMGYETGKLSRTQEGEYEDLLELLSPAGLESLNSESNPWPTGKGMLGLQRDRLTQVLAFGTHRPRAWARAGIRWQRTVAKLLS